MEASYAGFFWFAVVVRDRATVATAEDGQTPPTTTRTWTANACAKALEAVLTVASGAAQVPTLSLVSS